MFRKKQFLWLTTTI